ncbi:MULTISPECIES: helix-turn-helix domain-containing protein [Pseudomonas syringae group]|uniref:helix-turn-helix domain-containing protein n=1 Tax=Pseudomonas syringae group TaxID=136849 RepID=UPI000F049B1A|nr:MULTISPECIES: helix-turn-helix transcriptional regulator [Pseudomonas syringae group]MBI6766699.1 helix-turn-helix transcriptional regulator [Pseudomonas syringae]MBI6788929.1 helix-turn-helix transcriptional regulator [Pseudomonas syringae]
MALENELAATLRAIRKQRGLSYSELNEATFRTTLSLIERAKTGVSFSKLAELAKALDFDLIALVALCVALERGESAGDALATASQELAAFAEAGGIELQQAQMEGKKLAKRPAGMPPKIQNMQAVLKLKAQGKTQAEAVRLLGLSQSSVQRYWHLG